MENTQSLAGACNAHYNLSRVKNIIEYAIDLKKNKAALFREAAILEKKAQPFAEYQSWEPRMLRDSEADRVFPLESVRVHEYRLEHGGEIEDVHVHTGSYADELARSLNALAVTIGKDIYFRNNQYNPGDEEGRKLLAHELTHVAQYTEGRIQAHSTVEELESEAEAAEQQAEYDSDPYIRFPAGNRVYRLRKSDMGRLVQLTADEVERWLEKQQYEVSEQEYLELLCRYDDWLEGRV
ncbi:eCIS core domain-containing protein [Breznakiella homolactica]|uniref:DUF4157 domain-containing protein n=1 Tax=Breznakiella homolactica TaxID=2798577 RepID=A0A7T7XMJ9_9SPIR|nr:DUF4157 domain-containing protein [Breznakiella homolactica]QQO08998.1 DUF4157 domain-containing protein [Breznakiella homolactica]